MIALFKKWFTSEAVIVGAYYVHRDGSPWPTTDGSRVKVLDAKDGWVRYYMNKTLPDERMEQDMFLRVYEKDK